MSINITDLEIRLSTAIKNSNSAYDTAIYIKILEKLKNNLVSVVFNFSNLPEVLTVENGSIYLVKNDDNVYIADHDFKIWRLLKTTFTSEIYGWGDGDNYSVLTGNCASPITINSNFNDWTFIAGKNQGNFGIRADGTLWAFGGTSNCGRTGTGSANQTFISSTLQAGRGVDNFCTVSTYDSATAAITTNGTLWTWGCNSQGQLGDGTTINRSSPVSVISAFPFDDWIDISASKTVVAAIRSNGTIWTWGLNCVAQLGDGTFTDRSSPVSVVGGFTDWCAVSVGNAHVMALRSNGTLWGWGCDQSNRITGCSFSTTLSSPTSVIGSFCDWCTVSAGFANTAAIRTNGTLWTWGCNSSGELGLGHTSATNSIYPVLGDFTDWCSVSVGGSNITAIRTNGTLWTWGLNNFGQLGDGTTICRSSPVSVLGGFSNWCAISSYGDFAIRTNGTLWAWGQNFQGRLGNGTTSARSSPVSVVGGFTDWCSINNSGGVPIGIRTNGTLWSWGCCIGFNELGITHRSSPTSININCNLWKKVIKYPSTFLGLSCDNKIWGFGYNCESLFAIGTSYREGRSSPVSLLGNISTWCSVNIGGFSAAAVKTDGTIWSWGTNSHGVFGNNSLSPSHSPILSAGNDTNWIKINLGTSSAIALKNDGTLWTWGRNNFGQLGDGTTISRSSPVSVLGGFSDWCIVSAGGYHTAAIRTDGTLWAWGWNAQGRLGDETIISRTSPVSVVGGFTDWCTVSAGDDHTAAIRTNGTLWTWGKNNFGVLGNENVIDYSSPVSVIGEFTDWCTVSAGGYHTAAIRTNGTVWSWGNNAQGQLGDDTVILRSSPVSVVGGFTDWCGVSAGFRHTAAIRIGGTLWTWGYNFGINVGGQLGDGTTIKRSSPVSVLGGFTDWCAVSAEGRVTAAIRTNGTIWVWGCNKRGQLSDNQGYFNNPIQPIGDLKDWCTVSVGKFSFAAIRNNCTLWTWGRNSQGQLGDETDICRSSPVSVVGGFCDWCTVNAGRYHNAAIRTNGTLWAWGLGTSGQLGHGTCNINSSPVSVLGGFTDWCVVSAGNNHTAAIRSNGTLWAWGLGGVGQLGIGTSVNAVGSPVSVVGGFTDWCGVSASTCITAAIRSNGTIWSWGRNNDGQLGDGTTICRSSPVSLIGNITNWTQIVTTSYGAIALRKREY